MMDNINEINSNIANCTDTEFTLIQEYDNNKNEVTHEKKDYFNIVNEPKNVLYQDKKHHEIVEQKSKLFENLKATYKNKFKTLRSKYDK